MGRRRRVQVRGQGHNNTSLDMPSSAHHWDVRDVVNLAENVALVVDINCD